MVSLIQASELPGLPSSELLANASELLPAFSGYLFSTVKSNKRIFFVSLATSLAYVYFVPLSTKLGDISAGLGVPFALAVFLMHVQG